MSSITIVALRLAMYTSSPVPLGDGTEDGTAVVALAAVEYYTGY